MKVEKVSNDIYAQTQLLQDVIEEVPNFYLFVFI